ncbi:MAG TPA: oxygenase MpaB family protein [Verrucomicrobiota bacterium]|nr:oxygenase MpaB family protein [Verrucomicrobiota bacterium]
MTLAGWRQRADPPADAVIAEVYGGPDPQQTIRRVGDLLLRLQRNNDALPPGLPAQLRRFLVEARAPAEAADPRRLRAAQRVFARHPNVMLLLYLGASLPECYVNTGIAAVLGQTQRLVTHTRRRLKETAAFVTAVMLPGGFRPRGAAVVTALRVRLLHAAIRHLLRQPRLDAPPPAMAPPNMAAVWSWTRWPAGGADAPINQEELACTLLTFGYVTLRSLRRLGLAVSDAEADSFLYGWNVVGQLMGVDDALLPPDLPAAARLFDAIQSARMGGTKAGQELTAALVDTVGDATGGLLRDAMIELIRELIGAEKAGLLGLAATAGHARLHGLCAAETGAAGDPLTWLKWLVYRLLTAMPAEWRREPFPPPEPPQGAPPPSPTAAWR